VEYNSEGDLRRLKRRIKYLKRRGKAYPKIRRKEKNPRSAKSRN